VERLREDWWTEHPTGHFSRRRFIKGGLLIAGASLLASCGGDELAGGGTTETDNGELRVPETKPEKLIVRSWADPFSTAIGESAGQAFTKETGIDVEFDLTDIGEIHTKVQQSIQAGNRPPVDIVYTVGVLAVLGSVQGLAAPLDKRIVTNIDHLTVSGRPLRSPADYVNIYAYTFPIIYAPDRVQLPKEFSWNDLYDPQFRGRIHADYVYSGAIYPLAKILNVDIESDDLTPVWEKLEELRPNIGSVGADTEFIEAMKAGEVDLGYTLVANALALEDAGVNVEWIAPEEGVTLTVDSMYVARLLPEDVTYWAQVFINKVLDAQKQTDLTAALGVIPTNENAEPADFMKKQPEVFPFTDEEINKYALVEPLDVAARNNDEWQAKYNAAVGA